MFLLNSCLGQFSAASFEAPLLPKLRGHFAEFLNNTSSVGLRLLASSTCVGLGYGYDIHYSSFSRHMAHIFRYFFSLCFTPLHYCAVFPTQLLLRLLHDSIHGYALHMRPYSSVISQYRNLNLLSIGYAFRPLLRSRLTQGRSALPWKPWIFGRKDSHLPLATHSGILSSHKSTAPFGTASSLWQCSSTNLAVPKLRCRVSAPDIFGAGTLDQ